MFHPNNNNLPRIILCHNYIWLVNIAPLDNFLESFLQKISVNIALYLQNFIKKTKTGRKHEKIALD